jgi:hypothetical protein
MFSFISQALDVQIHRFEKKNSHLSLRGSKYEVKKNTATNIMYLMLQIALLVYTQACRSI